MSLFLGNSQKLLSIFKKATGKGRRGTYFKVYFYQKISQAHENQSKSENYSHHFVTRHTAVVSFKPCRHIHC